LTERHSINGKNQRRLILVTRLLKKVEFCSSTTHGDRKDMNNNSDEKRMSNVEGVEVDMEEEISPKDHIVLKSSRKFKI
jgi:hypothetical protein